MLRLQRQAGNRAVGTLLRRPLAVQRDVGWPEATGWNKGGPRTIDAGHKMLRVAVAGLPVGNKDPSPNPEKSGEKAADGGGGRAIVWVHPALDPKQPLEVLLHLHGLTHRPVDPFSGWRENNADPKTAESNAAKNPIAGKVRDVERDRIGQQLEAAAGNGTQMLAVLPQGTGRADFGKDFDPDAYVRKVLERLAGEAEVKKAVPNLTAAPTRFSIIMSAHSAGGATVANVLKTKRTANVSGLILFDAIYGETRGGKLVAPQRNRLLEWVGSQCKDLGKVLKAPVPADEAGRAADTAAKKAAVAALPGVRGYYEGGYSNTYEGLNGAMATLVKAHIPAAYQAEVRAKFHVFPAKVSHDRLLGQPGTVKDVAAAPLEDALTKRGEFVARQVQRQVAPGAAPAAPPAPPRTPAQLVQDAADRVRDAARAAAAPLVGTADGDDIVDILTQQIIRRERDTSAALRRRNPAHPALGLYTVLYGTDVVRDLRTIDGDPRNRAAANVRRRQVFQAILDGLVTDVRPRTAVAAPAATLDAGLGALFSGVFDRAVQVAGERAMVGHVLPFIAGGRTWDDVRIGVITEFGGLVDGTRTALARADAYYQALQVPNFRTVNRNTRVHPDLNAAFGRADAAITRRLAATPAAERPALTALVDGALRRSWSAVLRANQNAPHRLSDHSFGFAIDIDASANPNIGTRGGLRPVQDVTGSDPTAATTRNQTAAQVETTATNLRAISDAYKAAMASDAALAPVLLRLANDARNRARPRLPALPSGAPLVAAVVQGRRAARARALRAAIWPEGAAPATAPTPAPAPAAAGGPRPAAATVPPELVATERRIAVIGDAFRASFSNAARTRRVGATTEATPGSVAAHGFMSLPSILVGALAGSDAGNLRWLGTSNQDFMHFELMTRPPLYTAGAVVDPAPPDPAAHAPGATP